MKASLIENFKLSFFSHTFFLDDSFTFFKSFSKTFGKLSSGG